MQNEDLLLNRYFDKARQAAPLVSLEELQGKLGKPVRKASAVSKSLLYGTFAVVLVGIATVCFLSFKNKDQNSQIFQEKKGCSAATPAPEMKLNPPTRPDSLPSPDHPIDSKSTEMVAMPKRPPESLQDSANSHPQGEPLAIFSKKDTLPTAAPITHQQSEGTPSKVSTSGIVIYQFSLSEKMAIYQKKLAEVGIQMDLRKLTYDKVYKNRITLLHADFVVNGHLYKTVYLKDFKELRIEWETDASGKTQIKTMNILDQNYILKTL